MAWSAELTAGYLPSTKSTETTNTIPQFYAVCLDTANADGVVRPDNGNAGPVAGINESTGVDSTGGGGVGVAIQPGNTPRIANRRITRGLIANGVTVTRGDKLYTTSALQGALTNVSTSAKFVGYALETSTGGAADIIAVLVSALTGV